jgi:hypothetical protein
MPAPAASPTQRALRFVRSRDGRLALLSMALLVFQGTALSLTLRVSRRAPRPRPAPPCFGPSAAPQAPCALLLPCTPGGFELWELSPRLQLVCLRYCSATSFS